MEIKDFYQVVIIGGGPSGSSAGIKLMKNGIKTCIIDKQIFPRNKLCGGLLTVKPLNYLKI